MLWTRTTPLTYLSPFVSSSFPFSFSLSDSLSISLDFASVCLSSGSYKGRGAGLWRSTGFAFHHSFSVLSSDVCQKGLVSPSLFFSFFHSLFLSRVLCTHLNVGVALVCAKLSLPRRARSHSHSPLPRQHQQEQEAREHRRETD